MIDPIQFWANARGGFSVMRKSSFAGKALRACTGWQVNSGLITIHVTKWPPAER